MQHTRSHMMQRVGERVAPPLLRQVLDRASASRTGRNTAPSINKREPLAGNSFGFVVSVSVAHFRLCLHTPSPSPPCRKESHESAVLTSVHPPPRFVRQLLFLCHRNKKVPSLSSPSRVRLPAPPAHPSPILSTPGAQETSYSLVCDSLSLKCAHINPGTLLCLSRSIKNDRPRSNTVYTLFNGTATRQTRDNICSQFRRSGESL